MNTVWIVDDDRAILERLRTLLSREGYRVETADRPEEFLDRVEDLPPAVAILDIFFGRGQIDGEELIGALAGRCPNAQTIVMSGESDLQKTLACLRGGALDFLEKPISLPRLLTSVRNALAVFNSRASIQAQHLIRGKSPAIRRTVARIRKLAAINESVLILGESGTGKELAARNLHLFSPRYALPLRTVNCAALSPDLIEAELFGYRKGSFTGAVRDHRGHFEAARGSSLFIDEIGDFELPLQSRILRVLQEKVITRVGETDEVPVDVRFIFATHRRLDEMAARGEFRQDLYFRLSTFVIEIPPLRDRLEDIDILAPHFLREFLSENNLGPKGLTDDAFSKLREYDYPGNIRELAKIVKNAALFSAGERVTADDIEFQPRIHPADIWSRCRRQTLAESRRIFERELIRQRLNSMDQDVGRTAESLGILRNNLYRKFRVLELDWRRDPTED